MASNFWSFAATAAFFLFATQTLAIPVDKTPTELTARDDVNINAFRFFGWEGCNTNEHPDWSSDVMNAWDEVLEIGKSVTSDVDFSSDAAGDFFGSKDSNQDYQAEINKILQNIQTWRHDGTILAWSIHARCDDYLRDKNSKCPDGTKKEDEAKCGSRCYSEVWQTVNGRKVFIGFKDRAAAYTTNHDGTFVATINFCPVFFAMKTCARTISEYGKATRPTTRLDMVNYQCRGYVALHELFHINSMAHRVAFRVKHVYDRHFQIWVGGGVGLKKQLAYGPTYTKTLANWGGKTGLWVATNADSLAQYALSMYVTGKIGEYPQYPIVSEKPDRDPGDTNHVILDIDGQVRLTDNATLLGAALGVDPSVAYDTFIAEPLGCSDGGYQADSTDPSADPGPNLCVDNAENPAIELIPSSKPTPTTMPQPVSTNPTPTPSGPPVPSNSPAPPTVGGQQIAVASYIHPLADPDAWARLLRYPNNKVSVLIANVVNGPDATVNQDWKTVIAAASASGKRVIGYVRTGYLGVSQQQFKTRLGSTDLADWTAQIEQDVDMWYQLYPGNMGGIFFDEGWNDCGPNNVYSELYRHISDNTKRKYPGAYTVLNPGATMPKCFENSADTLLTFESSYESYTTSYVPNDWAAADSRKLWHIVYDVPKSDVGRVAALAQERGVGMIQITNDVMPNPYDNLPDDAYMQDHINAVVGGEPMIADVSSATGGPAASTPGGLQVTSSEYTSVTLSWSRAANAIGYRVYQNDQLVLSLTADMTRVTLGNLSPGTSGYTFYVTAEGGDGKESSKSNSVSSGTKTPPSPGKYVFNMKVSVAAASTVYSADIVVPYAFIRVYIWDSDVACNFTTNPGWPVNFAVANYVCTHYMVEGQVLYKYSGTVPPGTANVPWAWSDVGSVGVEQNGYTFTWNIPLGMPTTDTRNFLIQTEGYGPRANVFQPCPSFGGGPQGDGNYCA